MKTRKNSRFCKFETLESRQLMAGDVTATILSGNRLVITEAAGQIGTDNGVSISLVNGKIRVTGDYPAEGGSGISKINGKNFQDFMMPTNAFFNLEVNLGKGNDSVSLPASATLPTFQTMKLNIGNPPPVISASAFVAGGNSINNVPDTDEVWIEAARVKGAVSIYTGEANDRVFMGDFQVGSAGYGNLSIDTGAGSDQVDLQTTSGQPQSLVKGILDLETYDHITELSSNSVNINGIKTNGNLQVRMGDGVDTLLINDTVSLAKMDLKTGGGIDTATLRKITTSQGLFANMGAGNDHLTLDTLTGKATLDGGLGYDELTLRNVSMANVTQYSFDISTLTSKTKPVGTMDSLDVI